MKNGMCFVLVFSFLGACVAAREVDILSPTPLSERSFQTIVTVRDNSGNLITGLTTDRFTLALDDGEVSVTDVFPVTEQWLSVAMLIDKSGSMKGKPLAAAKEAAEDFVARCGHQTLFAVVPFDEDPLPEPAFLRKEQGVADAIRNIEIGKNTALYDAILTILPPIQKHWAPRRAMVALTDGKDTRSKTSFEELKAKLADYSVPVYTVGLGSGVESAKLAAIAASTGGQYFHAPGPGDLIKIYRAIAAELESGYVVRFKIPEDVREGGTHVLAIAVQAETVRLTGRRLLELTGEPRSSSERREITPAPAVVAEPGLVWLHIAAGGAVGLCLGLVLAIAIRRRKPGVVILAVILLTLLGSLVGALYGVMG